MNPPLGRDVAKADYRERESHHQKPLSGHEYRLKLHIQPLPGFPWRGKFTSVEELDAYFQEHKLTCLLCGRRYDQLGNHISQGHQISKDEYKEQFGLPWTYGLMGNVCRKKFSSYLKKRRAAGKIPPTPSKDHIEKLINSVRPKRPLVEAYRNDSRRKVLELHGREEAWSREDYEEFLRRIQSGRTPSEVGRDPDMPSVKEFWKRLKADPDYTKRYERVWKKLPHSVHVRANKLGEKFQKEIVRLRRKRLTLKTIAEILNVKMASVRSTWHKLKKQGKLTRGDLALEHKRRRVHKNTKAEK